MRRAAALLTLAFGAGAAAAGEPPAEILLTGGAVYTQDAARSWASAVAVRDGRIVWVGDDAGARAFAGPETRVVPLAGRMLLPAFQDAHVHPVTGGVELLACDLNDAKSAEAVLARVRDCAARLPADAWLVGGGWDLPLFPDANPSKQALDEAAGGRPACLSSADGHSEWVSSRALALAGIDATTPDPPNGRIERDAATGEPSGTLRESAGDLVEKLLPPPTPEQLAAGLALAVERAHRFGVTGFFEASANRERLETYRALDRDGRLGMHVTAALYVDPQKGLGQVADLAALRDEDWGPHVRATAAKIFADGVIESQTAALLAPYLGPAGGRGTLNWEPRKLNATAIALDRAGFQLHVHAIGDAAIREALDAVEAVAAANGPRDRRPTIAHLQLFDPADLPRFRQLGVVASFQPLWAYEDSYIRELTVPFLGPERSRWLYPIASVARTGAVLASGSDWSVSSMNPLDAIEVALTRRDPTAGDGPAWIPEERVDLATMLASYTIGAAWAAYREKETGSIEPGKLADLVVLDRNLFAIPATEINDARVLLTLFEGAEVYRSPDFDETAPLAPSAAAEETP